MTDDYLCSTPPLYINITTTITIAATTTTTTTMTRTNTSYHLAERPKPDLIPGKTFEKRTNPAPTADQLKDGEVLVEALYLSLDPAMRPMLNDVRSYVPPVQIGELMRGTAISRVLASKSPKAKQGDFVNASIGWQEVGILADSAFEVVQIPEGSKVTDALGVLGLTGLTAYFGLDKIGKPKKGDTVVISGAAGATGSVAGQIAKLSGAKVIGIAGSDDKCDWLVKDLGFDAALNYKSPTFSKDFAKATPDFIDVYWDNVGGEILELALSRAKKNARFVMCGSISGYNASGPQKGIRNLFNVVSQRIHMEGFIVFDFLSEYPQARKQLFEWLSQGKIQRKETIVGGGIDNVEKAFVKLFDGTNTGKLLLEVKNHESNEVRGSSRL